MLDQTKREEIDRIFVDEGLTIFGTMIVACYIFLSLAIHSFPPALESHRIRAEENLDKRAFKRFQSRWLGLWSEQDEAINGLRATLSVTASFVGEMMPRNRVFVSDSHARDIAPPN